MNAQVRDGTTATMNTTDDPRWNSVLNRDADADGRFFYSVKTTGVYCRPSCAARLPRPENVAFHDTQAAAQLAGFRPCKRCKPDQESLSERYSTLVTRACRIIEASESSPSLDDLSRALGFSPHHFHRIFKKIVGLTPRQYGAGYKAGRVRRLLDHGSSVTQAIFDAGYSSNSRFYETANNILGMTPSAYRAGGVNTEMQFAVGQCSLGAVLVARSERGVCAISLGDDPDALARELQDRFPEATLVGGQKSFESLVATVVGFIESPGLGLDLPLDIRGTVFQQRVWQALRDIPVGETLSYADVAQKIAAPNAARAVAAACAANVLAVAIPCHRVVRRDGSLSGYRWGVERKKRLLECEASL